MVNEEEIWAAKMAEHAEEIAAVENARNEHLYEHYKEICAAFVSSVRELREEEPNDQRLGAKIRTLYKTTFNEKRK